jgi:hypothetical protein
MLGRGERPLPGALLGNLGMVKQADPVRELVEARMAGDDQHVRLCSAGSARSSSGRPRPAPERAPRDLVEQHDLGPNRQDSARIARRKPVLIAGGGENPQVDPMLRGIEKPLATFAV